MKVLSGKVFWKAVEGTNFRYYVSTAGDVYSSFGRRKRAGVMSGSVCNNGYRYVELGRRRRAKVHRLVALAFIPNPENKPQVNHIDGDKLNNCVNNLEWSTAKENTIHSYATGLNKGQKGEDNGASKLTAKDVAEIRNKYLHTTVLELENEYGVRQSTIRRILYNQLWYDKDYTYKPINRRRKLTEDDVIEIKNMLKEGLTHDFIAKRYHVSRATITSINSGKSWDWVK